MPPVKKIKPVKTSKAQIKTNNENATGVISGQLDKKIKKQKQKIENQRGVVFIKHLPHGFFEEQLKKYFEQFGNVTKLRLVRSKRTGGSKGFAFVEFEYPEVAQVAAETMDNYLMFKRVVKASYIPPDQQRFNYFKTTLRKVKNKAGKDIYVSGKSAAVQRKVKQQNDWSDDSYQKRTELKLKKIEGLKKKYAHLGIDFSNIVVMPKVASLDDKAAKLKSNDKKSIKNTQPKNKKLQNVTETKITSAHTPKKPKNDLELEDLLGNTINDDSEDEDWEIMDNDDDDDDDDDEALTSDEETYGFHKNSDDEGKNEESDEEDDNNILSKSKKITKSTSKKPIQQTKLDRLDKLVQRKPGGIQKPNKKGAKKTATSNAKKSLQVKAIKELKPKRSLKNKKA